jgi:hypothetical protein
MLHLACGIITWRATDLLKWALKPNSLHESRGDSSWFGRFKNERGHGERFATWTECRSMAFGYIEVFYNRKRLYSTLGYKSPKRFLEDWLNRQSPENW